MCRHRDFDGIFYILYSTPCPSQEHEGVSTVQPAAERAGKMTHQPISWSCAQDDSCEASHTRFICSSMSVCAIDCTVQGDVPSSPAGLLRSITRGAYTALRAEGPAFKVIGLQEHLQRLRSSLACILDPEAHKELDSTCRHWLSADTGAHHESLWNCIAPTVRLAAATAKHSNPDSSTWMVVLHLCVAQALAGERSRLSTTAYIKPLNGPLNSPVSVTVLGPPTPEIPGRSLPAAKDSKWASDRMIHESHLSVGTTEGILCSKETALLEGLVTNLFVVAEMAGQIMLQTAHPSEGILDGVMRRLILQACSEAGVGCKEKAPLWEERHTWVQAFTTNSVAGVRMVSSMVAVWDTAATATISFDTSPSSRMQAVLAKLAGLFAVHSQSLLGSGHTLEEQQHEEIF
ncbi:hypothetical protein CVIRNUC_001353 [Coccomyxa viridis]|uniref:Class IV aminotransferase n=1 Tax=Coccomyxa viridis TaxID=1274662 RepID=A0AAV1HSV9_9CHLO|nr:hypothetical protein CVIRNUC_001353 [Coccomyxa viridis]